jgi:hypothetical protein
MAQAHAMRLLRFLQKIAAGGGTNAGDLMFTRYNI